MTELLDGEQVWELHATHGFPLELSLPLMWDRGLLPTWKGLVDAAVGDGMSKEKIVERLSIAAGDAYPPETAKIIRERLALL